MVRAVVWQAVAFSVALAIGAGWGGLAWGDPPDPDAEVAMGYIAPGLGTQGLENTWGPFGFPGGLRPLSELRWEGVVRQDVDAGCGPASLATLYTYYLDLPVTEEEMARSVTAEALRHGRGRRDILARGYSLGDLKRVAERGRLVTAAFRTSLENLKDVEIPTITQVNLRGYGHFVVLRGVVDGRAIVADPAFGNVTVPLGQFRKLWSGILLAIGRPKAPAQKLDFDPRGGPVSRDVDFATFRRGPALPATGAVPPRLVGARATNLIRGVSIGALNSLIVLSVEKTAIQANLE
jgi:predicted double-glycine peptidase